MIRRRIREGQPFMFLDEGLAAAGPVPSTNNLVESWNAWLAANAMTDERLERLYRRAWERSPQGMHETFGIPMRHGTGIDWNEFHTRVEWQSND